MDHHLESMVYEIAVSDFAPAAARQEVRRLEEGRLAQEVVESAVLLTSEIVSNAIRHGGAADRLNLYIRHGDETLWIGVSQPFPFRAEAQSRTGWGLRLLDALAWSWGATREADQSTTVFFQLQGRTV